MERRKRQHAGWTLVPMPRGESGGLAVAGLVMLLGLAASAPAGAQTAIMSLPYDITQSGYYYLQTDLAFGSHPGVPAIEIDADNVTLDLNGKTLSGPSPSVQDGIYASQRSNITVKNGTVTSFSEAVSLSALRGTSEVSGLTVTNAGLAGIDGGVDYGGFETITGNNVSSCGAGISVGDSQTPGATSGVIANNTTTGNQRFGIVVRYGVGWDIHDNTSQGNGVYDLFDFWNNVPHPVLSDTWDMATNRFGTANIYEPGGDLSAATNSGQAVTINDLVARLDQNARSGWLPGLTLQTTLPSNNSLLPPVSQAQHGTVSLSPDGNSVTYTPTAGFAGTDSFDFEVTQVWQGNTNWANFGVAHVTVQVSPVNQPPLANAGSNRTIEATGPTTPVQLDGSGSTDPDGDALTYAWSEGTTSLGTGKTPTVNLPPGAHSITLTVTDPGGASGTAGVTITVVDTTAPAITLPSNIVAEATGPNGGAVSFNPTAQDLVDGTVPVNCTPASGSTFPLGTTTVSCTATDAHGNTAKSSLIVTVRDTTPPAITVPGNITAAAPSASGAVVTFSTSAIDLVDGSVPVIASPASGSPFPLGMTIVNCTASDSHGNTATASFSVSVAYSWSGVLPPISPDGSSVFKLGRTVPVKFQLTGASAGITNAIAQLSYAKVSDGVVGDVNAADSTSAATSGNLFRYDPTSGQYIFNWSTEGLTTGTFQLQIDLGDGVPRTVNVGLR